MNTQSSRQCVFATFFCAFFSAATAHAAQDLLVRGADGALSAVGTVTVTNNGGTLNVEVATSVPFLILEAHAAAALACDDLPQTRSGNPRPGHFEAGTELGLPGSDGVNLTLDNPFGSDGTVCVAAHAVVFDPNGGATPEEAVENTVAGAWAEGGPFPGRNWAMHFEFALGATNSCNAEASCVVFITSQTFTGDLVGEALLLGLGSQATGLAAGDAICNHLAGPDGADLGGTFTAWLSDSSTGAADRVTQSIKPYKLTDGTTQVADDFADLVNCTNPFCLDFGIIKDEDASLAGYPPSLRIWTGTGADAALDASGQTCQDWASGAGADSGRSGSGVSVTPVWTTYESAACSDFKHLYCFQD